MIRTKEIAGREIDHAEFKRAVLALVRGAGEDGITAREVRDGLGVSSALGKLISSTLYNETKAGRLKRLERGRYAIGRLRWGKYANAFEENEDLILDCLRARGGYARWRDIQADFDTRVAGHGPRPKEPTYPYIPEPQTPEEEEAYMALRKAKYETYADAMEEHARELARWTETHPANSTTNTRLKQTIRRSKRIRQDAEVRGVYNLPAEEIAALPLPGRWAAFEIRRAVEARSLLPDDETDDRVRVLVEEHFAQVGFMVRQVREMRDLPRSALVDDPEIGAQLDAMVEAADHWRTNYREEAYKSDAPDARQAERVAALKGFEAGVWNLHWAAPADLYRTLAAHFVLDAAALSRGQLQIMQGEGAPRYLNRRRKLSAEITQLFDADAPAEIEGLDETDIAPILR